MALVAWYPLNGDSKDYASGIYDMKEYNTTISFSSGKFGKAPEFNKNGYFYTDNFIQAVDNWQGNFSWACWIKITNKNLETRGYFVGCNRDGSGVAIVQDADNSIKVVYNQWFTVIPYEEIIENKWYHICLTVTEDRYVKIYVDAKLKIEEDKSNAAMIDYTRQDNFRLAIGGMPYGGWYMGEGQVQDLRIYNHVLSQSEINEIYKSLILKYSFDMPIENINISTYDGVPIDINSKFNGGQNQCITITNIPYNENYFIDDNYIAISFDIEIKNIVAVEGKNGVLRLQEATRIDSEDGDRWSRLFNQNKEINNKPNEFAVTNYNKNNDIDINLLMNGKYHISRIYKMENSFQFSHNFRVEIRCDNISGGEAFISNINISLSNKDISSVYSDGILYDESGLRHNAIIEHTHTDVVLYPLCYSTESKIGQGCYQSKTSLINGERVNAFLTTSNFYEIPEISISFWLWLDKDATDGSGATMIGFSPNAESYHIWIRYETNKKLYVSMFGKSFTSNSQLNLKQWYYITVTAKKDGYINIYVDGELDNSTFIENPINWNGTYTTLVVGELRKSRGLSFDGKLDDLRIYATILSEEDIQKDYKERVKVDNIKNIYCKQLVENSGTILPEEYQLVKYLKNTNNSYIDTNVTFSDLKKIELNFDFDISDLVDVDHCFIFGEKTDSTGHYIGIGWGGGTFAYRYGTTSYMLGIKPQSNLNYKANYKKTFSKINGIIKENLNAQDIEGETANTMYLFGTNYNGTVSTTFQGKIYYFKIFEENQLINYFVPCYRKQDKKSGMYDLISNTFHPSLGESDLIIGEEINTINIDSNINFLNDGTINVNELNELNELKLLGNNNTIETKQVYEY